MSEKSNETMVLLKAKLDLVQPGANIFGGGIWKPNNDLNWAFQQIRPTGKPSGDKPKYNEKAAKMLNRFIPTFEAKEAGQLVKEIHQLTHKLVDELTAQFEAVETPHEALKKAREIAYNLYN